jgi:hypothetical protein
MKSNLIPITKIYDIYPKYTFSRDVKRFMDEIVDIPRADVYSKTAVLDMLTALQKKFDNFSVPKDADIFHMGYWAGINDCQEIIQEMLDVLKEREDGNT